MVYGNVRVIVSLDVKAQLDLHCVHCNTIVKKQMILKNLIENYKKLKQM